MPCNSASSTNGHSRGSVLSRSAAALGLETSCCLAYSIAPFKHPFRLLLDGSVRSYSREIYAALLGDDRGTSQGEMVRPEGIEPPTPGSEVPPKTLCERVTEDARGSCAPLLMYFYPMAPTSTTCWSKRSGVGDIRGMQGIRCGKGGRGGSPRGVKRLWADLQPVAP